MKKENSKRLSASKLNFKSLKNFVFNNPTDGNGPSESADKNQKFKTNAVRKPSYWWYVKSDNDQPVIKNKINEYKK